MDVNKNVYGQRQLEKMLLAGLNSGSAIRMTKAEWKKLKAAINKQIENYENRRSSNI